MADYMFLANWDGILLFLKNKKSHKWQFFLEKAFENDINSLFFLPKLILVEVILQLELVMTKMPFH